MLGREGVVRFGEALTFDVMNNASLKYLFNVFYFNVYIAAFELSFFFSFGMKLIFFSWVLLSILTERFFVYWRVIRTIIKFFS